jgi:hypothetical protein
MAFNPCLKDVSPPEQSGVCIVNPCIPLRGCGLAQATRRLGRHFKLARSELEHAFPTFTTSCVLRYCLETLRKVAEGITTALDLLCYEIL